ncbi:MAG TPA: hypothetical protein ENK57_04415 [Polyangiaceae bacterium]|nr:hypothetical protein [Polyangiaceae bacterium]
MRQQTLLLGLPSLLLGLEAQLQLALFLLANLSGFVLELLSLGRSLRLFGLADLALLLFALAALLGLDAGALLLLFAEGLFLFAVDALLFEVHQLLQIEEDGGFLVLTHKRLSLRCSSSAQGPGEGQY